MFKGFKVKAAGEVFSVDYDMDIGVAMLRLESESPSSMNQMFLRASDGIEWANRNDNEHYCTSEEFKEFVNAGGDGVTAEDARTKSIDVIQDAIDRIANVLEDLRSE